MFIRIAYLVLFLSMPLAIYLNYLYAPTEKIMGDVQRIFYFHMGYVLVFTLAFLMNLLYSIRFLINSDKAFSFKAYCHAEIGVLFTFLTIVSGMFWAKPVWGTWWTWDPQLTTTFILLVLYGSYLIFYKFALRSNMPKYASIFAIISFIDLPIVYISVRVMRGISPVVFGGDGGGISDKMMDTLLITLLAFFSLYIVLADMRLKLDKT